jgi:predicted nucleic acid-binding Zn ribbon protein
VKTCKNCGKILEQEARFCDGCGYDTTKEILDKPIKKRNNLLKITLISLTVVIITLILFFTLKNPILFAYHNKRGDTESLNTKAIDHYVKAIDIKYKDDLVEKIGEKVSECSDFEEELTKLEKVINSKDLNNMYVKNYIKKAEGSFNKNDYDKTWEYLSKAKNYDFKVEDFKYYNELLENQHQIMNESLDNNGDYSTFYLNEYIIYDSNSRYLTRDELNQYTKSELALIRNEIFARYGYVFNKDEYRNYFNSTSWYIPNPNFSGSINELNTIEKYNVELIKSLE